MARLAVASNAQGQGIGKALLRFALYAAGEMSDRIGCIGVIVDAKPQAVAFYERYGFEILDVVQGQLPDRPAPKPMFLAIGSIPRKQ